jgi:hypothetical protein
MEARPLPRTPAPIARVGLETFGGLSVEAADDAETGKAGA